MFLTLNCLPRATPNITQLRITMTGQLGVLRVAEAIADIIRQSLLATLYSNTCVNINKFTNTTLILR